MKDLSSVFFLAGMAGGILPRRCFVVKWSRIFVFGVEMLLHDCYNDTDSEKRNFFLILWLVLANWKGGI